MHRVQNLQIFSFCTFYFRDDGLLLVGSQENNMKKHLNSRQSGIAITMICFLFVMSLNAQQTPFSGSFAVIPGKIEAEDFDKGGEGIAYHDSDEGNNGGKYRPDENVDIEDCSEGGYSVGWIQPGEWLEYSVSVLTTGRYTFEILFAALGEGSVFHFEFDDVDVTGPILLAKTDGWQNWSIKTVVDVALDEGGDQIMKFAADEAGFNIGYINIKLQKKLVYPVVVITAPEDKADFYWGDNIPISAEASDSDGSVSIVEFYADGEKIGEDTSSPYGMTWNNSPIGKWDLTAVATDNDGARSTSEKVDITVKYPDFEQKLSFSHQRGFYASNFDLQITTDLAGAIIKYTLDGSDPLESSTASSKSSPVTLSINPDSRTGRGKTPGVVVRAVAIKNSAQVTKIETHSYIFIDKVKTQSHPGGDWPNSGVNGQNWHYDMNSSVVNDSRYTNLIDDALLDIPTLSLVTDLDNLFGSEDGIYVNAAYHGIDWERPGSIELINPDQSEGFQINTGIRIRGGWSRHDNYPKHAFRLFFREEYGKSTLKYPWFGDEGVDEFKKMDLRTSQNYAWSNGYVYENTMNRDVFSRDLQREMGQPYTRSRYYHLYINGLYWGLFQTQERPEANYAVSYFGGNKDDYDVVKIDIGEDFNLYEVEATDGNTDTWEAVWNACEAGFKSNSNYFEIEGKKTNGDKDPSGRKLVDIGNLIDYMLLIFYTGNFDAPVSKFGSNNSPNNYYAIINRAANDGFLFFAHDCEHTLLMNEAGPGVGIDENRVNIGNVEGRYNMTVDRFGKFQPQWLHHKLTDNAEYRMRFADQVYKHFYNQGVLTEGNLFALFEKRTQEIELAIIAESARWGDMNRSKHNAWQPAIDEIIGDYLPQRGDIVLGQLIDEDLYPPFDPPVFKNTGKEILQQTVPISQGYQLELKNPNGTEGAIMFTLDGSDPRNIGGSTSASALNAGDGKTIPINATTRILARILLNNTWSALHELILTSSQSLNPLRITEIHYNPLDAGETSGNEFEFIELKNTSTSTLDLSLASFTDGIQYTFPTGTGLAGDKMIVLASNRIQFKNRYGFDAYDEYEGQLNNGGERLVLSEADGDTIIYIRYNDKSPWPEEPDTLGYSLVYKNATGEPGDQNDPAYWRSSHAVHGSPGEEDIVSSDNGDFIKQPHTWSLLQNYPNPFNPSTIIRFSLKSDSQVELVVFDVTGKRIETLIDQKMAAGYHTQSWDARQYGAGIYFYRLKPRMALLKRKKCCW